MKNLLLLSAIACFLMLFIFLAYSPSLVQTISRFLPAKKATNPAARYCLEQGNERIIKRSESGTVYGFCRFRDGSICEEWTYYQGSCHGPQSSE